MYLGPMFVMNLWYIEESNMTPCVADDVSKLAEKITLNDKI